MKLGRRFVGGTTLRAPGSFGEHPDQEMASSFTEGFTFRCASTSHITSIPTRLSTSVVESFEPIKPPQHNKKEFCLATRGLVVLRLIRYPSSSSIRQTIFSAYYSPIRPDFESQFPALNILHRFFCLADEVEFKGQLPIQHEGTRRLRPLQAELL